MPNGEPVVCRQREVRDLGPERVVVLVARVPTAEVNRAYDLMHQAARSLTVNGTVFVSIGREDPHDNTAAVRHAIERMRNEIG